MRNTHLRFDDSGQMVAIYDETSDGKKTALCGFRLKDASGVLVEPMTFEMAGTVMHSKRDRKLTVLVHGVPCAVTYRAEDYDPASGEPHPAHDAASRLFDAIRLNAQFTYKV